MQLSDNATPEELIAYAEKLVWGNYGEPVSICYSKDTIFNNKKDSKSTTLIEREVCWYVVYLLWIWLTGFPWCSEKDSSEPKKITPQVIREFNKRTAYLLPELDTVTTVEITQDEAIAA